MPRGKRIDYEGAWHHVMNRGVARRTVFERREDCRYFKSRLALAVRRGDLEVHAFSLMPNHFHLLLRSPRGRLSSAMQRIENDYVRRFNRRRRRDGSLFRGRFVSKLVESYVYRGLLVCYIDHNAVRARLATSPERYPQCSAHHWLTGRRVPWLARSWISTELCRLAAGARSEADAYREVFAPPPHEDYSRVVRHRVARRGEAHDPLDDLLASSTERIRAWLIDRCSNADGTVPGMALVSACAIDAAIRGRGQVHLPWRVHRRGRARDAWTFVHVALLRELGGFTFADIGRQLSLSPRSAAYRYRGHCDLATLDGDYALLVAEIAKSVLRKCYPGHESVVAEPGSVPKE